MEATKRVSIVTENKNILRIVLGIILVLLIPFTAMQFTDEVKWSVVDFIIVGVLLGGMGFAYDLIARRMGSSRRRVMLALVLVAILLVIWVELAVGIFGTPFGGQ